jgi:hypothetical protein
MLFTLFLSLEVSALDMFGGKECLDGNFELAIKHESSLFGVVTSNLKVVKQACVVEVYFQKYFPKKWIVDVCREPIHIKYDGNSGLEVFKRTGVCLDRSSPYCEQVEDLLLILQDDGLIFAKGEKEDLASDHGQVYCSYLLLKQYLEKGIIYSLRQEKVSLGTSLGDKDSCDLSQKPKKAEVIAPKASRPVLEDLPKLEAPKPESPVETPPEVDEDGATGIF